MAIKTNEKKAPHVDGAVISRELELCKNIQEELSRYGFGDDNPPGLYIQTFGCQQNEADSQRMAGLARLMGYRPVATPEEAQLILVNTCAIREHAEKKALSIIGQFKHVKEADPRVIIGVGGCMVTQQSRADQLKHSYPYVSFTFDTGALHLLPELILTALSGKGRRFVRSEEYAIAEGLPEYSDRPYQAWLSIMYGCNNFCSYCIVPYVRGRERSRTPEAILAEARRLIDGGAREITLLGQNVNSYGKDTGSIGFAQLMREICALDGDFRLRFMTSHPKDASDELILAMAEEKKIVPHFHLPVQSGSDAVLEKMNRHYTREKYMGIIRRLKDAVPDVSITSDIIVGFPGETEADFADTLSILNEVRYDMIFSFIFSPRAGTPAASMDNPIPHDVSTERFARLLELQNAISLERNNRFVGRRMRVLCEDVSKTDASMLTGRSDTPRPIHFPGSSDRIGSFCEVEITGADTFSLTGKIAEN